MLGIDASGDAATRRDDRHRLGHLTHTVASRSRQAERFPYPTQSDANAAYLRLVGPATQSGTASSSIRLFGCKPGALDGRTARITRYRGPVVHCATDRIDSDGRKLGRDTVNFYYHRAVWVMQPVDPPRAAVSWRDREGSPRDLWWWLPGRARYQ